MSDVNKALSLLFDEVDDWFSHKAFHVPLSRITLDEDRARLAVIGRTTGKWFKLLLDPMTSIEFDDGITDEEFNLNGYSDFDSPHKLVGPKLQPNNGNSTATYDLNNSSKKICSIGGTKKRKVIAPKPPIQRRLKKSSISEKQSLDSLVRDLEFLLEKDEKEDKDEETFYYHRTYSDDELAMLDETIGYCCTLARETFKQANKEWSSLSLEDIRNRHETSFGDETQGGTDLAEVNNGQRNSNQQQSNDLIVQTVMPMDHDYLARPQTKPLLLSNKLLQQGARNKQNKNRITRQSNNPKSSSSSVINTEALKRLAPFSDQIRLLSNKYSRLFSVESD